MVSWIMGSRVHLCSKSCKKLSEEKGYPLSSSYSVKLKGNLLKEHAAAVKEKKAARMRQLLLALKAATPVDTGEARDSWHILGDKLANTADHISKLNQGTSKQAPSYFIEKTLLAQSGVYPAGVIVLPTV
jgi:hypothetical protein